MWQKVVPLVDLALSSKHTIYILCFLFQKQFTGEKIFVTSLSPVFHTGFIWIDPLNWANGWSWCLKFILIVPPYALSLSSDDSNKKRAHSERPPFALVNIFCHRWQHFFATKKGWGLDPWGYLQNPFHILRVRHSYAYFETTIFQICSAVFPKKCHLSILAFHKYYIID